MRLFQLFLLTSPLLVITFQQAQPIREVVSKQLTAAYEMLAPAGETITFGARPVDIQLDSARNRLWIKDSQGIRVIDLSTWKEVGSAKANGGSSLCGLLCVNDGNVLFTNAKNEVIKFRLDNQTIREVEKFSLIGKGNKFPCGIAFSAKKEKIYVCQSLTNSVAELDAETGKLLRRFDVGIAPYEILISPDSSRAFVTCQGGRHARAGERTAKSAGTPMPVDDRGVSVSGTVSVIDLNKGAEIEQIAVGLQPCALQYSASNKFVYVANANDDSISILDATSLRNIKRVPAILDPKLPFGSMPNGLVTTADGARLFVSLAGNNAVAVYDSSRCPNLKLLGFIPTAWYPGALALDNNYLYVACTKGLGSVVTTRAQGKGKNSWDVSGTVQRIPLAYDLQKGTGIVREAARVPQILSSLERGQKKKLDPKPVPLKVGDPSVFDHVIYVIKENRTYDQVFGDIASGDGDANLCTFGEKITPNHHAIAKEFVLLDNYYCNGVCSADGHAWAIEGNVTPYLEREFGGFERSYDYGTDPITYSNTGFIWDPILQKGLSFRNFGELGYAELPKGWKQDAIWRAYEKGRDEKFGNRIEIARLAQFSCPNYPGWDMAIPDVLRLDRFLKEFREWERIGQMPNFVIVYLPQDHTAGTSPAYPTAASYVADNDLAMGRLLAEVSASQFWKSTVVFANEDDPQNGYDHIDGHRSICLVASPYTKRGKTISKFYNQDSVLHTILRIFGLPAFNQKIAMAPLMTECFTNSPNTTPYIALDPKVDLNAMNPALSELQGDALKWAKISASLPKHRPDFSDPKNDLLLNRIIWHAMKGTKTPYPVRWEGPHGKGLKKKGLRFDGSAIDID